MATTTAGTTEALVQSTCNLPKLDSTVISPHLTAGEARAKAHIGDTIYAAIVAGTSPYVDGDKTALKRAEALLIGAIALRLSNLSTAGTGVFGGVVNADGGTNMFLGESRVESMAARYEALAYQSLEPYWRDYRFAQREDDEVEGLPDPNALDVGRITIRASS